MKVLVTILLFGAFTAALGEEEVVEIAKQTAGPVTVANNDTLDQRQKIIDTIFQNYNKHLIPDRTSLKFGLALISFDANAKKQVLESSVFLRYVWKDSRLEWNKDDFPGVSVIRYDSDAVWKPDFLPYNSAQLDTMMKCHKSQVLLYPNGEVLWVPPCELATHCKLTLRKNPYGEQQCTIKFGSWTYDGVVLDANFYDNKTEIDISDFVDETSDFKIISTTAEKEVKTYECCPEPYVALKFNVTFKRIPGEELFARLR